MKLLLDENLPKKLKSDFPKHEVFTVRDINWNGKKNGELMLPMLENTFGAFITFDKNLQFQQNFKKYLIPVLVLNAQDNTYQTLMRLTGKINLMLQSKLEPGPIKIVE